MELGAQVLQSVVLALFVFPAPTILTRFLTSEYVLAVHSAVVLASCVHIATRSATSRSAIIVHLVHLHFLLLLIDVLIKVLGFPP